MRVKEICGKWMKKEIVDEFRKLYPHKKKTYKVLRNLNICEVRAKKKANDTRKLLKTCEPFNGRF